MPYFEGDGKTDASNFGPGQMLSALSHGAALVEVAKEVEEKAIEMVDKAE